MGEISFYFEVSQRQIKTLEFDVLIKKSRNFSIKPLCSNNRRRCQRLRVLIEF